MSLTSPRIIIASETRPSVLDRLAIRHAALIIGGFAASALAVNLVVWLIGLALGLQERAREKLAEIESRLEDLQNIKANLLSTLDAGCDDLHRCVTTDCCSIPFFETITRRTNA